MRICFGHFPLRLYCKVLPIQDLAGFFCFENSEQVFIFNLLFGVSYLQEAGIYLVQFQFGQIEAQVFAAIGECGAATASSQYDFGLVNTNLEWIDDFVSLPIFDNPILVDARGVGKCIGPYDCFVGLYHHPHTVTDQLAGRI